MAEEKSKHSDENQGKLAAQKSVPLALRHPAVPWITRRLQLHLDAAREILNDFLPHINELDEKHLSVDALVQLRNLPESKREKLRAYMDKRFEIAREGDPPSLPIGEDADQEPGESEMVSIQIELDQIEQITGDRHFTNEFVQELEQIASGPLRVTILHNSLLAMAIGAFEVLVAGIATRYYVDHPNALDSDEKSFSFAELREFGDVDDAADEMISRRITSLMYGGLGSWADWFAKYCDADIAELAMNYEEVQEAFQRRHVVLHNGGLASRQYLRNVGESSAEVGERLPVTAAYLDDVFDELDVLGTTLGVLAEGTWHPDGRDAAAGALLRRCFELMVEGRWEASQALAAAGKRLKCVALLKTSLQCNEWLCRAERFGYESVREEVERDFDASHMSGRFKIVRQVLLDELDEALVAIPEVVETKEITRGELEAWPILRKLREHAEFAAVLAKLDAKEPSD